MRGKQQWFAAGFLLLVLLFGVGLGVGGSLLFLSKKVVPEARERIHQPRPDHHLKRVMSRLSKQLDLSEEQKAAISAEIEKTGDQFRELHGQISSELEVIMLEGQDAVRSHLGEDQLVLYEEYLVKSEKRRQFMLKRKEEEMRMRAPKGDNGNPHWRKEHPKEERRPDS